MVRIRKVQDDPITLYKDGELVGLITTHLVLNDIRIQIKKEKATGYSVHWNDRVIRIDHRANLEEWPVGMMDILDNQLDALIEWAKESS